MKRSNNTLYNVLDDNTGEYVTYQKVTGVTDADCDGIIYRKLGSEYFKRFYQTEVYARDFGVTADNSTDDYAALQAAIDYCLTAKARAVKLVLPNGRMRISQALNVGTVAAVNSNQTSFCIEGQGWSTGSQTGSSIVYVGASGPGTSIINHNSSTARYTQYKNFQLETLTDGAVDIGLNFPNSTHSALDIEKIRIAGPSTSVKQNVGTGGNAEFTQYVRCKFERFSVDGYYHDAPQALSIKFLHCAFSPKAGATVFNFPATSGGTFIGNDVSYAGTTVTANTFLKVGGNQSDPLTFVGGRLEGVDTLVKVLSNMSKQGGATFTGVTVGKGLGRTSYKSIDYTDTDPSGNSRFNLQLNNCIFYGSNNDPEVQEVWVIDVTNSRKSSVFFDNCWFSDFIPVVHGRLDGSTVLAENSTQSNSDTIVEFRNCTKRMVSGTAIQEVSLDKLAINNSTVKSTTGLKKQQNFLLKSKYTESNGANVVANSPWVHTGDVNFSICFNLIDSSGDTNFIARNGKRIRIGFSSGVYQNISGINITTDWSKQVFYKATLSNSIPSQLRIALVNSSTLKVYDEVILTGGSSNRKHTVLLNAHVPPSETGSLRLVQENLSTDSFVDMVVLNQGVYIDMAADPAYTDGSSVNNTQHWDVLSQTTKVRERLQVPVKPDTYGSALVVPLPETEGEIYYSTTTNTYKVYQNGAWQQLAVINGISGSFTAQSGETITVTNGLITAITP